ncbi:MAG: PorT family protein [Sphingobacteriaceae bacterium]|jgi:opacity protein-like surface antigen|nr:PorT family protein [Sphingobacteriaceae bacterium]
MKQRFFLFCLFSIPLFSFAQVPDGKNFRLAFTVSPTFGWMEFPTNAPGYENVKYKTQSSYGVIGDFGFAKNYFFSSGLTLTTVGSTLDVTLNGNQKIDYKIQYIEIPLTLKLKSNEAPVRYYGQFGLDAGITTSTKHSITQLSIPNHANTLRMGLLIGGGTEWHLTQNMNVLTGVSYNKGFTKVFDSPETKNSFVTLNLGVFF